MTSLKTAANRRLLPFALVLLAVMGSGGLTASAQEVPEDIRPIVRLAYPRVDGRGYVAVGSGTIVTPDGLILTNAHVYDLPEETLATADIGTDSVIVLYDHDNDRHTPPEPMYVAERLAHWYSAFPGEPEYDVAAVRIVRNLQTGRSVEGLRFPFLELGNPFELPDHAVITVLGFPGAGGQNLAVTSGSWVNYQEGNPDPRVMDGSILVAASAWPGNSGGAAIHDGRLIGIPTFGSVGTLYVNPISWAVPLFTYLRYRLDVSAPNIPAEWVRSPRNRDGWTRSRATLLGRVRSSDGGPVSGALVYVYAEGRSLESVRRMHSADGGRLPFVRVSNGRIVYAAYTTDAAGFFEAWIEQRGRFQVGIVGSGFRTLTTDGWRPANHFAQSFGEPFVLERIEGVAHGPGRSAPRFSFRPCLLRAHDSILVTEDPRFGSPAVRVLRAGEEVMFSPAGEGPWSRSPWIRVWWLESTERREGWVSSIWSSYETDCPGGSRDQPRGAGGRGR